VGEVTPGVDEGAPAIKELPRPAPLPQPTTAVATIAKNRIAVQIDGNLFSKFRAPSLRIPYFDMFLG
jgi:hypothetical protein